MTIARCGAGRRVAVAVVGRPADDVGGSVAEQSDKEVADRHHTCQVGADIVALDDIAAGPADDQETVKLAEMMLRAFAVGPPIVLPEADVSISTPSPTLPSAIVPAAFRPMMFPATTLRACPSR